MKRLSAAPSLLGLLLALIVPGVLAVLTLQTLPNGSSAYPMIDVGETQVVLNVWGTLHATGYPHYVLTGSAIVAALKAIGVPADTAPAIVSLLWGLIALGLFYALALHLTGRVLPSTLAAVALGSTRAAWLHNSIAEIYSLTLLIAIALLAVALWGRGSNNRRAAGVMPYAPAENTTFERKRPTPRWWVKYPGRIYALALIGGIGVAHHRTIALLIPALLVAVWPDLWAQRRHLPKIGIVSLALGLIGFLPYLYLPLREVDEPKWTYGEPDTLDGFLDQFLGREGQRFLRLPADLDMLADDFALVTEPLIADVTLPGVLIGLAGLILALRVARWRRAAGVLLINFGVIYAFNALIYHDPLPALALMMSVSLALGWAFALAAGMDAATRMQHAPSLQGALFATAGIALIIGLIAWNLAYIRDLTRDPTGLETIAQIEAAPAGSTVMLAWGPRYFAAAFARDVLGDLDHIALVDDKADFAALLADGAPLITPEYTFYQQPRPWWEARIGSPVYLTAAAPDLVAIKPAPEMADPVPPGDTVMILADALICGSQGPIALSVAWVSPVTPERDLSVFVHLVDAAGTILTQGDQAAPVYGWRPLTTWLPGEIVRDVYPFTDHPLAVRLEGARIRYGLYDQDESGTFVNVIEAERDAVCGG